MRKGIAVITAVMLCVSSLFAFTAFAEGNVTDAENGILFQEDGDAEADAAITAVAPAFQVKQFVELNNSGRLIRTESMSDVNITEKEGTRGLLISGKVSDLNSGRIVIDEDFDFDEKPEGRNTEAQPVGRISLDGLSDKSAKVVVGVFLDDEVTPCASMLLRKKMGNAGWTRDGAMTKDVLSQNITGKHKVSIDFSITGIDTKKTTEVLLRSLTFCENSIPVMYFDIDESEGSIDAMNASENHDAECYGSVTLQVPSGYKGEFSDKELRTIENMELDYVRGRGNSTWSMDKKPYKVKFDDKQNLLGMGKNEHWVLLANRFDNSLLRNRITYWIARDLGMEYAIKCAPVEVVMNGRYFGSYLLSEQVRVGKNRVDIPKLDEDIVDPESVEITGGYLLNLSGYEESENVFATERAGCFEIESPDLSKYSSTNAAKAAKKIQRRYIANYVDKVENALFGNDMKDEDGHSYDEYLDEQSAIDYWWVQEFSINGDAFLGGSNYLYKKRQGSEEDPDGKLYWGPLWDFDYVAWGNPNYDEDTYKGFNNTTHPWMKRLRTDEAYCRRLLARWSSIYDMAGRYDVHLSDAVSDVIKKGGVLDQYYDETRVSEYYDWEKWGFYNEEGGYYSYTGKEKQDNEQEEQGEQEPAGLQTYESEIEHLRGWIADRQAWVAGNITDIGVQSHTVRFLIDGTVQESRRYDDGDELGKLPGAPEKAGYTFIGWCDEDDDPADEELPVYYDIDLFGKYVKTSKLKKAKNIYFQDYDAYTWFYQFDPEENEYRPNYALMPAGSVPEDPIWSVDHPEIAEVSKDGTVTAKKPGTVTVTATISSGGSNSFRVTFVDDNEEMSDIEEITLNKTKLSLKTGAYTQLKVDQDPKPHYYSMVEWFSADPGILSVDGFGIVKAKKPGKTVVVAIDTESRLYAVCKVTVTASKAYRIKTAKAAKVTGVKAKSARAGKKRSVKVSWKKAKGVSGYYVLRSLKKNGKYRKVGTVKKAKTVKWTDKKATKGRTYYYKVRPFTKVAGKKYSGKLSKAAKCKVR